MLSLVLHLYQVVIAEQTITMTVNELTTNALDTATSSQTVCAGDVPTALLGTSTVTELLLIMLLINGKVDSLAIHFQTSLVRQVQIILWYRPL